ncbi:MAG: hypothetical protein P8Y60_11630, partial [Calditrichota bacterium]
SRLILYCNVKVIDLLDGISHGFPPFSFCFMIVFNSCYKPESSLQPGHCLQQGFIPETPRHAPLKYSPTMINKSRLEMSGIGLHRCLLTCELVIFKCKVNYLNISG